MSNEAFEKWAINYGLDYESSFTRDDVEAAWQAAKADSESILSEQQNTIAELKNEVIEKCAKVCESSDRHRGEYFASKIRALKGK